MELQKIFTMQKGLDSYIEKKHGLEKEDLFDKKVLALLVELGELANETRCFKFWSIKSPPPREVILEEFVDGVHFIASLGIECGYDNLEVVEGKKGMNRGMTEQFLRVFQAVETFRTSKEKSHYVDVWEEYLNLAILLGFSEEEIKNGYVSKNEVNYQRQKDNY